MLRGLLPRVDQARNGGFRKLPRDRVVAGERNRAWRDGNPSALFGSHRLSPIARRGSGRLPSGVGKLDARDAAVLMRKADDARPGLGLRGVPDAGILFGNAALRRD